MATDEAYLRACRALNWRNAQLRAHGIESLKLDDSHGHEPPLCFDFGPSRVKELEEALTDLLSWFPSKASDPEWRIKGGAHGADDAVAHARELVGKD